MLAKRCFGCGVEKPLDDFHRSAKGLYGRRSKCKECFKPYYQEYFRRPERVGKNLESAKRYYDAMSDHEKKKMMHRIRKRRERDPTHMLGKSLRRGLERHPTNNPVTLNELKDMWSSQDGKCAVSGVVMIWAKGNFQPTSMSIDRIDPSGGYSKDNVRLVCYQVNTFRGRWSDDQMIGMARAIITNADSISDEPTWNNFHHFHENAL
jgi:hypothetical protein